MTKKLYTICPEYKKSLSEIRTFYNEETKTRVSWEELWRSGSFVIALTDEEYEDLKEAEFVELDDYPHEIEDTWDCCYSGFEVFNPDWDEDQIQEFVEELEELAEEEFMDEWFENNDYMFSDAYYEISCKPLLEVLENTEYYEHLLEENEDEEPVDV